MWKLESVISSDNAWCNEFTVVSGTDTLSLKQLIDRYGETLVGKRNYARYGNCFPLRFRITNSKSETLVEVEKTEHDSLPFTSNILDIDTEMIRDYSEFDTFSLIVCKSGSAEVSCNGSSECMRRGDMLLVPASARGVTLTPVKKAVLVENYIR